MYSGRSIQEKYDLKDINASEIVAKIVKGETVDLDHVRILGNLDIGKLDLPKRHIGRTDLEINSLGFEENISIIASIIKIINSEIQGASNFCEAAFDQEVDFSGSRFTGVADFRGAKFHGPTDFSWSQFGEDALFSGSQFTGGALFDGCRFNERADFLGFRVRGPTEFRGCQFNKKADFVRSRFSGYIVDFSESEFRGNTEFIRSMFGEDTYFNQCVFIGDLDFSGSQFKGDVLTFKHSKFSNSRSQEDACRRAKNILEKNGDREESGYHFYQEMDAKRKQRPWYLRYPEFVFIQMIFGYGVHPGWLMAWWGIIVTAFGSLYWIVKGIDGATISECIKFSFATAIAPGYIASVINPGNAGYRLIPEYHAIAMAETIVGTFLWAGFIATFARKYMK